MEAKVKIRFRDKYTHNLHLAGEIIEVSKERYEEIEKVREGILEPLEPLEPVPEETQEENQEETPGAERYTKSELKKMNVEELKKLAEEKGVSAEGKKDEIIERIVELEENDAQ
mgnify:CR=1 FL=1|jgi:hypothetical protein